MWRAFRSSISASWRYPSYGNTFSHRWAPKQKQRIPEIVFDVDTQQNHTTLQLYLFQRWARKMYVVPGVLWVHTSSDELLILSACHWAGLVGDQPLQRGPPCLRGRQTSHLIYTFAGRQGEGHTTKHQRAGGLEELGTIVFWHLYRDSAPLG